jgi:hypothetical protein
MHWILSPNKANLSIGIYSEDYNISSTLMSGYAVAQLVEALRYKPEGRGFDFW